MQKIFLIILLFFFTFGFSQVNPNDTIRTDYKPNDSIPAASTSTKSDVQVLADIKSSNKPGLSPKFNPTKAGLYSAVFPGLGQFYNKKYWKIPVVFGAIGTGLGVTFYNDNQYKRYRTAFIAELNGQQHEFSNLPGIDKNVLGNAQDQAKRQRDYAIAITALIYILNIVDAVVDAHLYEGRHDPDLAISPTIINDGFGFNQSKAGLALNFKF
ncbi:DUF5683 domain-containing protein [Halpernia frigidisoli]|uniref:DUF5683 domain-containing protein n=1 Tax=Halpernia frigidisoli TaxID=1125876 RepID=A0A1I3E6W9_9FLAO|nr:DUF5683 domain-containing protein [Halpernia frigidisoli]SFH94628.1 hypothetical protein SAMN05443292_0907 [Halpernia frigidisoli]